ncbi:hypothetical protein BDC45DRAFT_539831 [Circinella umbellata]|nr:hypothetical protein BDC45DRAFT_539831 [Circinella umbellata]
MWKKKTEGRNPNAGRETNGTKAFSSGEFMIACGDKKILLLSVIPRKLLSTNRTINKESTISQTAAIECIAAVSSLFEVISMSSKVLTVVLQHNLVLTDSNSIIALQIFTDSSSNNNLLKGVCKKY